MGMFSNSSVASLFLRSRTVAASPMVTEWFFSPDAFTLKVIWASLAPSAMSDMVDLFRGCGCGRGGQVGCRSVDGDVAMHQPTAEVRLAGSVGGVLIARKARALELLMMLRSEKKESDLLHTPLEGGRRGEMRGMSVLYGAIEGGCV